MYYGSQKFSYGIIVFIVVILMGIGLLALRTQSYSDPVDTTPVFVGADTTDISYTVDIVRTDASSIFTTGTYQQDGQGNAFVTTGNGPNLVSVYSSPTTLVICQADICRSSDSEPTDTAAFTSLVVGEADILAIQQVAEYFEATNCPNGGRCDRWRVDTEFLQADIILDQTTQYIQQLTTTEPDGATAELTYTYEPVVITLPSTADAIDGV